MIEETQPLDEATTIALLRAGRTGSEPPMRDLTGVAVAGGRRLRRRRVALGSAALLLVAGAAAVAGRVPGGQGDEVVSAVGGADDRPADAPAPDAADAANLQILLRALGGDFRTAQSAGVPSYGYLEPVPGSPAATALPPGYAADAVIAAVAGGGSLDTTCSGAPEGPAGGGPGEAPDYAGPVVSLIGGGGGGCTGIGLRDGRQAALLTDRPALYDPTRTVVVPGEAVELRRAGTVRDGVYAQAALVVRADRGAAAVERQRVPQAEITAWLDSFVDKLVAAATDAGIAAGTFRSGEANVARLQRELGPAWRPVAHELHSRGGLPDGMDGVAVAHLSAEDTPTAPLCEAAQPDSTCVVRETADGRPVAVRTGPVERWPNGSTRAGAGVILRRSAEETVHVGVSATGPDRSGADPATTDARLRDWLAAHVDALVRAAADPGLAQPLGHADPRRPS